MVPGSQNGRTATFLAYGGLKTAKIRKRKTEVTISLNKYAVNCTTSNTEISFTN